MARTARPQAPRLQRDDREQEGAEAAQPPARADPRRRLVRYAALAGAGGPDRAPGSSRHHGAADVVARHPLHQQRHQLPRTVAVFLDLARRGDDVGPSVGLHIVLGHAAAACIQTGDDQHAVGVPLIGRARKPAKGLLVAARAADAGRIERPEIELGVVIAGLRRLLVARRHRAVGRGIGQSRGEVDRCDEAAGGHNHGAGQG